MLPDPAGARTRGLWSPSVRAPDWATEGLLMPCAKRRTQYLPFWNRIYLKKKEYAPNGGVNSFCRRRRRHRRMESFPVFLIPVCFSRVFHRCTPSIQCWPDIRGQRKQTFPSFIISDATRENVPSEMCAKLRLRSACASAQSDQSLRCSHEETLHPWPCT